MDHPEYWIPKINVPITCHTAQGESVSGDIFVDVILTEGYSVHQVVDYFNSKTPFFPLRLADRRPILVAKESVVQVDIPQLMDQFREDTSSFSTRKDVVLYVHSLGQVRVTIIADMPEEHSRILDLVNLSRGNFFPAVVNNSLSLLSIHHIYKIEEA